MVDDQRKALPETEPHAAPIFDTGPYPQPLSGFPSNTGPGSALSGSSVAVAEAMNTDIPDRAPAAVIVPGQNHSLKRWKLLLVLVAVWLPSAGVGLALFSWWYHLVDKTPAVFVVLLYVVACTVAGLMLAMVPDRPVVSALAVAVMSAVFASVIAAAVLYGHQYCQVKSPCLAGIVPY